ncbi:MAG: MMPL family transporter [Candidatus Sericytochromatia bacterium]
MPSAPNGLGARLLGRVADTVIRHPWRWLLGWVLLLALALPGTARLATVLQGANGGIDQSEALAAEALLQNRFRFPFAQNYVLVVNSPRYTVASPELQAAVAQLRSQVEAEPDTQAVQTVYDGSEFDFMQSADGHKTFLLVGQKQAPVEVLEKRTGEIRSRLQPVIATLRKKDPQLTVSLTGMNAVVYDINAVTSKSTEEAEQRVLLLTLGLLLLAFGSLTGAFLPVLMALFANGIGLGLIYVIAQRLPVSIYAQTIATMIGLAVGIDYALLVVWRLREERARQENFKAALRTTLVQAGQSVFFAGFTFAIGLAGLFFTGITALYSIGLGGVVVVALSIALSLTLLPALLLLLEPWLEFPRALSQRLLQLKPSRLWEPLAQKVMHKPLGLGLGALLLVMLLSSPALKLDIGEFDIASMPDSLESKQGFAQLSEMSVSGVMVPMFLVIGAPEGETMLAPERLNALQKVHRQLSEHPLIERVYSLAGSASADESQALFNQLPMLQLLFPQLFELFLSQDQQLALVQVIPKRLGDYDALVQYTDTLRQTLGPDLRSQGLSLAIGGSAPLTLDYNIASFRHMGKIMLGVIGVTWLVLLWALRSYLIALKAVLLNLCSVGVSYGVITAIFQLGWLPGVAKSSIMAYVPLLLFCIIFGMSIDYEVFLMARIKEEHDAGADNETATLEGIRATGDVITYAALIMCIVFGAFTLVEISIIKQLGFGLATAILVDATLIRMVLVPAFMKVAGKWNWYPGA